MFESDSQLAISWVADPLSIPWQVHNFMQEYCNALESRIICSFTYIGRMRKDATDIFAKMGFANMNFIEFV